MTPADIERAVEALRRAFPFVSDEGVERFRRELAPPPVWSFAREDETMGAFLERLATMAGVVPANVHEHGWQWRPTDADTAFAPPFGTIRQCRVCGCLVAGGPTACARCAEVGA